jgi:3-oxoacyl-[acyl-carrier-protein] synthase III
MPAPLDGLRLRMPVARLLGRAWDNEAMLARVRASYRGDEEGWRRLAGRLTALWKICGTDVRTLEETAALPLAPHAAGVARVLLTRESIGPGDLDVVIHADIAREVYEPATAAAVADTLGAHRALPYDVTSACAGAVLGLQDAAGRMVLDDSLRHVLITTATLTDGHLRTDLQSADDVDTLGAGLTLGNAATAMLLTRDAAGPGGRIVAMHAAGLPAHRDLCAAPVGGHFRSDGAALFALARHVPGHLRTLCDRAGWDVGDVDLWICHQPSNRVLREVAHALGVDPGRMPGLHHVHGNCAASAVPLALAHLAAEGRVRAGQRVVLTTAASGFVMAGVALTWEG